MQGHGDSWVGRDTDGWQVIKYRALSSACAVLGTQIHVPGCLFAWNLGFIRNKILLLIQLKKQVQFKTLKEKLVQSPSCLWVLVRHSVKPHHLPLTSSFVCLQSLFLGICTDSIETFLACNLAENVCRVWSPSRDTPHDLKGDELLKHTPPFSTPLSEAIFKEADFIPPENHQCRSGLWMAATELSI